MYVAAAAALHTCSGGDSSLSGDVGALFALQIVLFWCHIECNSKKTIGGHFFFKEYLQRLLGQRRFFYVIGLFTSQLRSKW